jgi:prepilin-type N-terminal cleavage/methylation domain-containing protein
MVFHRNLAKESVMTNVKRRSRSSGFTLVEMAIVLVIVGLLLGGVLKGQEIIKNARYKSAGSQYKEVAAALTAYSDRYKAVPGDDTNAGTRWPGATPGVAPAGGNGYIDGGWQTQECAQALDHLRRAGLISVPGTAPNITLASPWNTLAIVCRPSGFTQNYASASLVYQWLPQGVQTALDVMYDDGTWDTGAMRSNANPGPSEFDGGTLTHTQWMTWAF